MVKLSRGKKKYPPQVKCTTHAGSTHETQVHTLDPKHPLLLLQHFCPSFLLKWPTHPPTPSIQAPPTYRGHEPGGLLFCSSYRSPGHHCLRVTPGSTELTSPDRSPFSCEASHGTKTSHKSKGLVRARGWERHGQRTHSAAAPHSRKQIGVILLLFVFFYSVELHTSSSKWSRSDFERMKCRAVYQSMLHYIVRFPQWRHWDWPRHIGSINKVNYRGVMKLSLAHFLLTLPQIF